MAGNPGNESCLHLIARASSDALQRCRALYAPGDELLLIDDAVMLLAGDLGAMLREELPNHGFLRADLEARGLAEIADKTGVRTVTDLDFAALLSKHGRCLTWK